MLLRRDDFLSDQYARDWRRSAHDVSAADLPALDRELADVRRPGKVDVSFAVPERALLEGLTARGFFLGNTKLSFVRPPTAALPGAPTVTVRPAEPRDRDVILSRSAETFVLDRYRSDPALDPARTAALYRAWLANNLDSRCEVVFVAESDAMTAGYLCVIAKPEAVYFELIAVFPGCAGKGIGKALLAHATRVYGSRPLEVVTQLHNVPMQRALVGTGFSPADASYVYTTNFAVSGRGSAS